MAARPATMAGVQPIARIRFITGLIILAWDAAASHQFVFRWSDFRRRGSGFGGRDPRVGIRNSEFGIWNAWCAFLIPNSEFQIPWCLPARVPKPHSGTLRAKCPSVPL